VKPPYNIGQHTQEIVLQALENTDQVNDMIMMIVDMRYALEEVFNQMPIVERIYPSDANFLLVKMKEARKIYEYLLEQGIVVRDRSKVMLCEESLRITVGTEQENTELVDALGSYIAQLKFEKANSNG
jgi:histidinol-phosphate aminotransferase